MANKRPLSLLAVDSESPSAATSQDQGLKKQRCFEIRPVIMKRSEIYNNCAPVVLFHKTPKNGASNSSIDQGAAASNRDECRNEQPLASCLRGPSQALRRQSQLGSSSASHRSGTAACSVQFRPKVTVRRIPSRHEYGEDIKRDLWTNLDEIRVNALRNEAEFVFDGGNWRECTEEDQMYFDHRLGSLVHPAHVDTSVCVYSTGQGWEPISEDNATNDNNNNRRSTSTSPSNQQRVCSYAR